MNGSSVVQRPTVGDDCGTSEGLKVLSTPVPDLPEDLHHNHLSTWHTSSPSRPPYLPQVPTDTTYVSELLTLPTSSLVLPTLGERVDLPPERGGIEVALNPDEDTVLRGSGTQDEPRIPDFSTGRLFVYRWSSPRGPGLFSPKLNSISCA